MPSKFTSTARRSGISAAIGCVDGSWSCRYAQVFSTLANVVHADVQRVASTWHSAETNVANDSLSHRSSHQRIVTRSPNHMRASSWRMVSARRSYAASGTFERKTLSSWNVMHAAFSIAPALNSGTKSWSNLSNAYRKPKAWW